MAPALHRKVFCIGLGKTGTSTFGLLMRELGSNHITGPVLDGLVWRELERFDKLDEVIAAHDSFDDFPHPFLYARYAEAYPDSRFVLTTRSSEHQWLDSLKAHHLRKGPTEPQLLAYGCYSPFGHEERLLELYRSHNAGAREYFAGSDRFIEICWEWEGEAQRLAAFLGIDAAPDIPHRNASADKNPRRIINKFLKDQRYGAAIRYARSLDDVDTWLAHIDRKLEEAATDGDPEQAGTDRSGGGILNKLFSR